MKRLISIIIFLPSLLDTADVIGQIKTWSKLPIIEKTLRIAGRIPYSTALMGHAISVIDIETLLKRPRLVPMLYSLKKQHQLPSLACIKTRIHQ